MRFKNNLKSSVEKQTRAGRLVSKALTISLSLTTTVGALPFAHSQSNNSSVKNLVEQEVKTHLLKDTARAELRIAETSNQGALNRIYKADKGRIGRGDLKIASTNALNLQTANYAKILAALDITTTLYDRTAEINALMPSPLPVINPRVLDPNSFPGTKVQTVDIVKKSGSTFYAPSMLQSIGVYNPNLTNAGAKSLFFNIGSDFVSTMADLEGANFLMIPEKALVRKMELLTGFTLSDQVMTDQAVDAPIDFSRAPRFKEILISTLFLRADFTGTMISRALIYHAQQGTKIRIMMSNAALTGLHLGDSVNKKKDLRLFDQLKKTPNIEMQEVAYKLPEYEHAKDVNEIHRAHHAKLIVMLAENPAQSRIIVGGRNLSDAYTFLSPPDHSEYPQLIQYQRVGYMPVEDMEVEVKGTDIVNNARAQFLSFWNRDVDETQEASQPFHHIPNTTMAEFKTIPLMKLNSGKSFVRHFWHSPFMDKKESQLESLFVTMVDSARKTIQIVTPYFNLPDRLKEAMIRASQRGVKITVLTNASLHGDDFLPGAVTAANKIGMSKMVDYASFSTWDNQTVMLHSKMFLIDSELLYVGSVNLNKRSFSHDVENGLLITGSSAVKAFQTTFNERYLPVTRVLSKTEITSGVDLLNKSIITVFNSFF